MIERSADSAVESRMFGALISGRLRFISDMPAEDIAALDQANAGASDLLRGADIDPHTLASRRAFAAGIIVGASDLTDAVRLGIIRGLLAS
jgi:hypothetical protein